MSERTIHKKEDCSHACFEAPKLVESHLEVMSMIVDHSRVAAELYPGCVAACELASSGPCSNGDRRLGRSSGVFRDARGRNRVSEEGLMVGEGIEYEMVNTNHKNCHCRRLVVMPRLPEEAGWSVYTPGCPGHDTTHGTEMAELSQLRGCCSAENNFASLIRQEVRRYNLERWLGLVQPGARGDTADMAMKGDHIEVRANLQGVRDTNHIQPTLIPL